MSFRHTVYKIFLLIVTFGALNGCSSPYSQSYREDGISVTADFFGEWIYIISDYLFWIYAIVFGLLAYGRRKESLKRHVVITFAIYASFQWTSCPACACIIPYYIGLPLMYIPNIKNRYIDKCFWGGTILVWIYLCFMDWQKEGFVSWIVQIGVWGVVGLLFAFFMTIDLEGRCPYCGHFALSNIGETDRFQNAVSHFKVLDEKGSDQLNAIDGSLKRKSAFRRCGCCLLKTGNGL